MKRRIWKVRHIFARLWQAVPWISEKDPVMGQGYCNHCESELDDTEIW